MKLLAPAKINLYLRVVGKRKDGCHLLDTVIAPVSLCDEIEIYAVGGGRKTSARVSVTCDNPAVPSGRGNLAYKAAKLLLDRKGIAAPVRIHIRKRIPVGAGLGGGSTDAAATLVGLNRLFGLRCSRAELVSLATSLGADVPFFIVGRPARARGIGERLRPLRVTRKIWLVILYPGFPVSTRWVYRNYPAKLTKNNQNTSINFSWKSPQRLANFLVNDLEIVAVRRYPSIGRLKRQLVEAGAAGALMSGSGSSVFGIFSGEQRARSALRRLQKRKATEAFLVHTLS